MLNCQLSCIHQVNHTIPFTAYDHTHTYDELTYYLSGNGTTKIHNTTYPYTRGTFCVYRKGTLHNESNPEPCGVIWMHFSCRLEGISLEEGAFSDSPNMELLQSLLQLRNAATEQRLYQEALTESCLARSLILAAELQKNNTHARRIDWQEVLRYIDENITGNPDFSVLAAKYHYSLDRFRHLFREHFGMSPYHYLQAQRIVHAKRLLSDSSLSLTDIAYHCGFTSSSQFSNLFRRHAGKTPGEYRAYPTESE